MRAECTSVAGCATQVLPHIFSVAEGAYRWLTCDVIGGAKQSVVVSGESGAGKVRRGRGLTVEGRGLTVGGRGLTVAGTVSQV